MYIYITGALWPENGYTSQIPKTPRSLIFTGPAFFVITPLVSIKALYLPFHLPLSFLLFYAFPRTLLSKLSP